MKNAGIKITVETSREDGSLAQQIVFDQRGLDAAALLEVQAKGVMPMAQALLELAAKWNQVSAEANKGPTSA